MYILIVKTSAIGDIIQTFPLAAHLRQRFPDAKIHWLAEKSSRDLLEAYPIVDTVLCVDTKRWRRRLFRLEMWREFRAFYRGFRAQKYDLVIDVQGNCKSGLFTILARGAEKVGFSWSCVSEKPNVLATNRRYFIERSLNARMRYLKLAQMHLKDEPNAPPEHIALKLTSEESSKLPSLIDGSRFMVAFGSKWRNKRLPEEILISFLQQINAHFKPGFLFPYGTEEEEKTAKRLAALFPSSRAIGNMSLPLWQHVIAHMECLIAMDSAALHLGSTTKTPIFSLFGSSSSDIYSPLDSKRHKILQGSCPYNQDFVYRCPKLRTCETGACMRSFSPEALFAHFLSWWKHPR